MKRFGQIIKVKPEFIEKYEEMHANVWPEVLSAIKEANMKNYSIYRYQDTLFAYFEYVGSDFDSDMKKLNDNKKMHEWWVITDNTQNAMPDRKRGEWWMEIPEIFHLD